MIKQKLQLHLKKSDLSLQDFFRYADKDKSKGISIVELTKAMVGVLTEEECRILFLAADKDNSGDITPEELIRECSSIHQNYVFEKIRKALEKTKGLDSKSVMDKLKVRSDGTLDIVEFNEIINMLYGHMEKYEVDALLMQADE